MTTTRVYLIATEPYIGWTKIGKSDGNPRWRVSAMQCGNPLKLCVVAWWFASRFPEAEAQMHEHFAPVRGVSEWFAFPPSLLMEAKDLGSKNLGYVELMERWPAQRILDLADSDDPSPEALALRFSALTTNLTTPKLRILEVAGESC